MKSVAINDAWSVMLADDGRFVLYRLGKEFGRYKSAHVLWRSNREKFGRVPSAAFVSVLRLSREDKDDLLASSLVQESTRVGYWKDLSQFEQLRRKEGKHVD
ncbi:hypothetical protein RFM99_17195 [Mesorhizobium sp. VK4C]|uniref:hypothetical protein n=1 Tax=Mesorhizobium captivum TaxID=3072319 RepID=UPI002A243484|nr:hypothetical protein [Mesorhizobium sp. VK4C]MDX8500147.1 hypothetical protein [Mesorhizobium sp. VK4C]